MVFKLCTLQQPTEQVLFGDFSFGVHECNNHFIQVLILILSVPMWRVDFAIEDLLSKTDTSEDG